VRRVANRYKPERGGGKYYPMKKERGRGREGRTGRKQSSKGGRGKRKIGPIKGGSRTPTLREKKRVTARKLA